MQYSNFYSDIPDFLCTGRNSIYERRLHHDRKKFEDAFSEEWVARNIPDKTNEFVIYRQIIPWQKITDRLVSFYNESRGCIGISLRIAAALLIVAKLRLLSDRNVVSQVRENRYLQYFCNVPDNEVQTFIHHSSLSCLRARFGPEGAAFIESEIFEVLRRSGAVSGDSMLTGSTVLENNIVYPTDIGLIFKAFGKMRQAAARHGIPLWRDDGELKKLWRDCNLNKNKGKISENLLIFSDLFSDALKIFREKVMSVPAPENLRMLQLLNTPEDQNMLKIRGERHIENRIVSPDEPDARPIKKGKKHPSCEFGTTLQLSFNRQGFMVTVENFIGKPDDSKLWSDTSELFIKRMKEKPGYAVGDQGYRSRVNLKIPDKTEHIFPGKSTDAAEKERVYCRKARSATEGFIAVAKNLRGFGCSLYRGIDGDRIWSSLCQTAYNLKKFLQLYRNEELTENCLIRLGLLT